MSFSLTVWPYSAAVLMVIAMMAGSSMAVAMSPERAAELVRLVRQDCGSCHGMTLKGGLGKPLVPEAIAHLGEDQIAAIILDGLPGTPMPPWRSLLSADDAVWIAAQLKRGFPP